jgi:hypothetical protein
MEFRKLHNEELNDLYSSPNIMLVIKSRRMRWLGHVARVGEGRGVYRVLVGKLEGKKPLRRPRRRCEDNIKMDLQEVGCGVMDWIELAQTLKGQIHIIISSGVPRIFFRGWFYTRNFFGGGEVGCVIVIHNDTRSTKYQICKMNLYFS